MKKCDIIIPIYNAYDYVKKCIETVIKNTDLIENTLILINDKSPDEKILPLLKKIKEKNKNLNIEIINNKENLGFVKTVNIGMKHSDNDVLLLNSDTEVPKNWLNRIKTCAYSKKNVATVTPLSNNATLVSVPYGLINNDIPNKLSIDDYDKIIENCSFCDYPELPTAHGFCMYIKREALDLVGFFDEKSFGKGYGEENDFSYRCLNFGYCHLLCDNVVVFHKESQSFNNEREKVIRSHSKILHERYPLYYKNQKKWCKNYPIAYIGKNIMYELNKNNNNNILLVLSEFDFNHTGDINDLFDVDIKIKEKYNFHILYFKKDYYVLVSLFKDKNTTLFFEKSSVFNKEGYFNDNYQKMFENICESFNISNIHVLDMKGHFFNIVNVAEDKKINLIVSILNDYFFTPTIEFDISKNDKYEFNKNIDYNWHGQCDSFLEKANRIVVNNEYKEMFNKKFKLRNVSIINHSILKLSSDNAKNVEKVFLPINERIAKYYVETKNKKINKTIIKNHSLLSDSGFNDKLDEILNSTKWKLINKIVFPNYFIKIVRKFIKKERRGE